MPNLRTMVTEIGTALGMLGHPNLDEALAARSPVMRSLSPEDWDQLTTARQGGAYDPEFHAAWENGHAFLRADDGLRGRIPQLVEWKGAIRAPGDEVAPVDLRIDHVYLVSCKYLSNILLNVSPAHIFDDLLVGGQSRRGQGFGGDWFAEVAPQQYQQLYDSIRPFMVGLEETRATETHSGRGSGTGLRRGALPLPGFGTGDEEESAPPVRASATPPPALRELPEKAADLSAEQRIALASSLKSGWPEFAKAAYSELSQAVALASAARWQRALAQGANTGEAMLWRLLRMGSAPYYVLGSTATRSLRLRIATPWDWRQLFALERFEVFAQAGGQARVGWLAQVRERSNGAAHEVSGHVEIRWSHGRFKGPPEAKGYLDSRHHLVPGYFPLT